MVVALLSAPSEPMEPTDDALLVTRDAVLAMVLLLKSACLAPADWCWRTDSV